MQALNSAEKKHLLEVARYSIAEELGIKYAKPAALKSKALEAKQGVFVTLHEQGELRGCIGCFDSDKTLDETVAQYAKWSAFNDHRFAHLSKAEFDKINIEISVLTPAREIDYDGLVKSFPKKPGVIIELDIYNATFLPQVWDDLPEPDDFMGHLCMKAGLKPDEWKKPGMGFYVYEVIKIEEGRGSSE
jgi:AmmeMemoRadiSam system protein A